MAVVFGDPDLQRRVFTGVAAADIPNIIAQHDVMAQHVNNLQVRSVVELPYARKEGIPLDSYWGEKHRYTCILLQNYLHTIFSYESYDYTDHNGNVMCFSRFIPPHEDDVNAFLSDQIIY